MPDANRDANRHAESDVRWSVTTATGDHFVCRVDASGGRIEVRLFAGKDDLICARVVPSLDAARRLANRWLRAVIANHPPGDAVPGGDAVH
jgi:hypothetical protein